MDYFLSYIKVYKKQTKKKKSLFFLAKWPGKRVSSNTEDIRTMKLSTSAKYYRKNYSFSHPVQERPKREPRFLPSCGSNKTLYLIGYYRKKPTGGLGHSSTPDRKKCPSSLPTSLHISGEAYSGA